MADTIAGAAAGGAGPAIVTPGDSAVRVYKIVVMGDGSSGKTSIVNRYAQESFGKQYKQTIGLDFYSKRLDLPGGVSCTLQLWDIGGQSLAGKMINNYLEGADAVLLVYDMTNLNSFGNLSDWADLVATRFADSQKRPHIAVVGNKRDLSHLRVVTQSTHEAFAKSYGASAHLVSAKTGDGVALMFRTVVANLTGIRVTKAETERLSVVMTADVVHHADAPAREVKHKPNKKNKKGGKTKSSVCSIQ